MKKKRREEEREDKVSASKKGAEQRHQIKEQKSNKGRRRTGNPDATEAEHRGLKKISNEFLQASSIQASAKKSPISLSSSFSKEAQRKGAREIHKYFMAKKSLNESRKSTIHKVVALTAHSMSSEHSASSPENKSSNGSARSGTNISCKGSVDTTITGIDTMAQSKGRNVKKRASSVDTKPGQVDTTQSQVDTRAFSQGINWPVWDSVSTLLKGRSTHSGKWNMPGHMKGECPESKKEKHKKIHKFKKQKAMVATWSDEDSSEKEEEEKSSSSDSEEICFMTNSSDGKVDTISP
ncbi:hypothetical protein Taro_010923 [Colocasia esculenta]|uniref:Uncharacterized protein n=1 Tax=Colocasia esculenta TaxID=4460 RepID=A0A843UEK1_COLES|nr:hypothetical protein [Colocasia esculenta]